MTYNRHRIYAGGVDIVGWLRVVDRRFQNDAGWFSWRGVADLAAMGDALHGRGAALGRRLDAYQRAGRTVVRMCGMLGSPPWVNAGLDFGPQTPGYADARESVVLAANARGMYVEWCLFADAQYVMPDPRDREVCVDEFAAFCRAQEGVTPQLVNEPYKNGWDDSVDPALLRLAARFEAAVGHRHFSIGDPGDGDDVDASAETTRKLIILSQHSNIVVLHPSRAYGGDKRFRRWVDHLEGMTDVVPQLRPGVAYVVDEPTGAALVNIPGRRDSDPDAHAAAQFVSLCCGFGGYTYHAIQSEIDVDQFPGFYEPAAVLAEVPTSPDWRYYNDAWAGAPTEGITWVGLEGKLRHLVRGQQAWSVAYGEADYSSVKWRAGWVPRVVYSGPRIRVWAVNQ